MGSLSAPEVHDAARRHFKWLCGHPDARLSDRLKRLLAYLLEHSIRDSGAAPSQADIARDVLDRSDFDPSVDAHARVEMARLRNALELFYARLESEPPVRFDLPKGSYRVVLKSAPRPVPETVQPPENDCVIALAEPVAFTEDAREFAQLVISETLHRCSHSPIVRSGALSVTLLPPHRSHADAMEAAKAQGAAAVAVSQVHTDESGLQVFVTVFDTISRSLVGTRNFAMESGIGRCALARKVGATLSAILSDPFTGTGPQIVARRTGNMRLNAILGACGFVASQELVRAPTAFKALRHVVDQDRETCPTAMALFADMHRVCHNAGIWPDASLDTAFELADRAYRADRGNAAALLALGYAALSSGSLKIATSLASHPAADEIGDTFKTDHALLGALTTASRDPVSGELQIHDQSAPVWSDMLTLMPAIRSGDETAVLRILGPQRHGESMWHDIFRSVAAAYSGERRMAGKSVARLAGAIPEINLRVASILAGFFPDPGELDYLVGGLRKAGMPIEAAAG